VAGERNFAQSARSNEMRLQGISGYKRKLNYFLGPFQQAMLDKLVPHVPMWLNSVHLVLLTIPAAIGVIVTGYLARQNIWWIVGMSWWILWQYVTDALDGEVGRRRHEGLILWGFYMDHVMDFLFICSVAAGYALAYQFSEVYFLLAALVASGFFVHEYLIGVVKGKINTTGYLGFGTTELRMIAILANLALPLIPRMWVARVLELLLPASFGLLMLMVYRAQKNLRQLDLKRKNHK
jgi:phosphatidylglycerophosphate synthase